MNKYAYGNPKLKTKHPGELASRSMTKKAEDAYLDGFIKAAVAALGAQNVQPQAQQPTPQQGQQPQQPQPAPGAAAGAQQQQAPASNEMMALIQQIKQQNQQRQQQHPELIPQMNPGATATPIQPFGGNPHSFLQR